MRLVRSAPWGLFAFFVLCFALYPGGVFDVFRARDADDYMRLLQVRALASGQSWFDFSVARLGAVLPWSRLPDVPLLILGKGFGLEGAALIVPLILCAALVPAVQAMTRPLAGRVGGLWASIALFACAKPLLFQFRPTRVDHHAYVLIFSALGFAALMRMILVPRALAPSVLLASSCALALWIGAEAFPFLLLVAFTLGVVVVLRGGLVQRRAALFGIFFGLFSVVILLVARRPEAWASHELSWFSSASVLFALLTGATFVFFDRLASRLRVRAVRAVLFASLALLMAALFFMLVPEAKLGPYADFEPVSAKLVLGHVAETHPLYELWARERARPLALVLLTTPLVVPLFGLGAMAFARGRRLRLLLVSFGFMLAFLLGALFWQQRVLPAAQLFALPLVGYGLIHLKGSARTIAVFALIGLSAVAPGLLMQRPLYPDLALFYAASSAKPCDVTHAAMVLGDPAGLGASAKTVAAVMSDGPALLYHTPHRVLAAPYNVPTNGAMLAFFSAREDAAAQKIAAEEKIDLVLVCRMIPKVYAGQPPRIGLAPDGRLRALRDQPRALIERLARSEPPVWLRFVAGFDDPAYRLYEVVH